MSKAYRRLAKELGDYKPSLVYSRQLIYAPGLKESLSQVPVIFEINSDDINETLISSKSRAIYKVLTRGKVLSTAKAMVYVTNELSDSPHFAKFAKKRLVLANGVDASLVGTPLTSSRLSLPLQVGFIGSPGCQWHGIDKVAFLIEKCPEFDFHIIGTTQAELLAQFPELAKLSNLKVHGYHSLVKSSEILAQCDVGIATLALHRNGMSEACPLKSRHYLALGLPIIAGYDDTDLMNENLDFVLHIGNAETNVVEHLVEIKEFIQNSRRLHKRRLPSFP